MTLVMGDPIPVADFTYETREAFTQAQRAAVEKALIEARTLVAASQGESRFKK